MLQNATTVYEGHNLRESGVDL